MYSELQVGSGGGSVELSGGGAVIRGPCVMLMLIQTGGMHHAKDDVQALTVTHSAQV